MFRKKILFLSESLNVGGAEKTLVSLLKILDYSKYDVTLMLISRSGGFVSELENIPSLKVKNIIIPSEIHSSHFINVLKINLLYKWMPSRCVGDFLCKGYDVIIPFCEGYLTKWIAASSASCKKIAWVHTDMVNNDWPVKSAVFRSQQKETEAYQKFDTVVAVSGIVAEGMKEKFGCKDVRTIYNILDPNILTKSKETIEHTPRRKLNLISVGRLEYVKGYDILIEAFKTLILEHNLDISLTLVGDGSQRATLEKAIMESKLQDYVRFVGSVSNPYPYIADADVFVCPSRQEGFNIAILEAMTLGKPIIATRCAGPEEILDKGKYGVLSENNIEGIIDGILRIYDNQAMIDEYASKSQARSRHFDAKNQMSKIEYLING